MSQIISSYKLMIQMFSSHDSERLTDVFKIVLNEGC